MKYEQGLLTTGEVQQILGVTYMTLFRWIRSEMIKCVYLPNRQIRIYPHEVDNFLAQCPKRYSRECIRNRSMMAKIRRDRNIFNQERLDGYKKIHDKINRILRGAHK
jgi:excisionase family DNA binding protein